MHERYKQLSSSYATVGLELVISILFGFFGGRWLDEKLHTHGWLTWLGFGFGVAAGFRAVYRAAMQAKREAEEEDERERNRRRGISNGHSDPDEPR